MSIKLESLFIQKNLGRRTPEPKSAFAWKISATWQKIVAPFLKIFRYKFFFFFFQLQLSIWGEASKEKRRERERTEEREGYFRKRLAGTSTSFPGKIVGKKKHFQRSFQLQNNYGRDEFIYPEFGGETEGKY